MAPQKSPAFQFYAQDFLTGTASMSLQEVGAYIRLLAHQWHSGSVPEEANDRARLLGCARAQERELWKKVGKKFVLVDGVYINERLEEERRKQTEYRRRQSDNGRASAEARRNHRANSGSTVVATVVEPSHQPLGQPNVNSSSSSSSSRTQEVTDSPTSKHRSVPTLVVGGAQYAKLLETHAFVGSVLRVPKVLHAELLGKSGGAHREQDLQDWYLSLNERLETSGKGTGDVFEWLRPRHQNLVKERGWIEAVPVNGTAKSQGASLERLEAIARGEIKR